MTHLKLCYSSLSGLSVAFTLILGTQIISNAATIFDCNGDGMADQGVDQCMLSDLFANPNASITVTDKKFFMFVKDPDHMDLEPNGIKVQTAPGNPGLMFMVKNPSDRFDNVLYFDYMAQVTPNSMKVISDVEGFRNGGDSGAISLYKIVPDEDGEPMRMFIFPDIPQPPGESVDITKTRKLNLRVHIDGGMSTRFDIKLSQMMPEEKHSVVNPNRDLSEFKIDPSAPDITPSLESQLSNELKTLINNDRGTNFIFFDQVSNEIQILASLVDFPLLTDSSFLVSNGFTDLHLVYRDAMGSNSGMDLGLLNQGEETFFTVDASMFNPEFNTWQLTYAACNPNTNQCMEAGDDEKVPEPTSTLSLFSLGILGAGATLKRKVKRSHSLKK